MSLRYRRARAADLDSLCHLIGLSFGFDPATCADWIGKADINNVRLMLEDGSLVACLIYVPMGQWFGGRSTAMVGIAGVAASPSVRGRGVATELMRRSMRELHREGMALSALYPAAMPLYRRAGYEVAGASWRYSVAGRDLPSGSALLTVRDYEQRDEAQVRKVYAAHARDRAGWLDRGTYVWERTRRNLDGNKTFGHVLCDKNRVEGYVFYRHKRTPMGFNLMVTDMAARTPTAYHDVLSFLGGHRSLADEVVWFGGVDDPWLRMLRDRHYDIRLHHHWMLRIVNVKAALEARGYPHDLAVALNIQVRDDVVRRGGGRYRLRIAAGRGQVSKGSGSGISLDIRTLAALYAGEIDARAAARLGKIKGQPRMIARAAMIFSGPPPSLPDFF